MKVVLFTYHAEFTTGEYYFKILDRQGDDVLRIGLSCPQKTTQPPDSLCEMLGSAQPDLLFFVDPPGPIWPLGFEKLKCPSVAYLIDVHQDLDAYKRYAPFFDYLFIAQRDYIPFFKKWGFENTFWLPHACDPQTHQIASRERDIDVGFVGKFGTKDSSRHRILSAVLPHFKTNKADQYYPPSELALIYGRSKIVFNASIHGDLIMRVFEALASGALLVTDRIKNGLDVIFQEDIHYVGYSDADEAMAKICYYLSHPEERFKIAAEGQRLALQKHTYRDRWEEIQKTLMFDEKKKSALVRTYTMPEKARAYVRVYEKLRLPLGVLSFVSPVKSGLGSIFFLWIFLKTCLKKMNRHFPMTPNAIRARLNNRGFV